MTLGALINGRIGALAGGKVYCVQAPENTITPYIIWRPISGTPIESHDSKRDFVTALVQVDHYATTASGADALRTLTINAMVANDDTTCTDDARLQYEDAVTPKLYNAQADFEITYAP